VNRHKTVERFDFHNHESLYDEICSVGAVDVHTSVHQWEGLLRLDLESGGMQLEAQAPQ
jgi:hypothetical protein